MTKPDLSEFSPMMQDFGETLWLYVNLFYEDDDMRAGGIELGHPVALWVQECIDGKHTGTESSKRLVELLTGLTKDDQSEQ